MKQRFNNLDLKTALNELRHSFTGCRVANIYDLDNKTYLIKLAKPDKKAVILIESGIRIHGTEFEWPKNLIPSGFSMKLRKHLRSRRLESVNQIGADRIVDLQFGSNEAAYHLIVELYDRGNILLTDFEYTIITVLRPRTDADADVKFTVREKYPSHLAKQQETLTIERLRDIISAAKDNDDIKKVLTLNLTFGAALVEHCLTKAKFPDKCLIGKQFDRTSELDLKKLYNALLEGEGIVDKVTNQICKGYIIQKKTTTVKLDKAAAGGIIENDSILTYEEFHPYLFIKHESLPYLEFESFDKAVDEFFSKLESQKIELKESQQSKEAIKKLENVKRDHQKRIEELKNLQTEDEVKAMLIEYNLDMVDRAIYLVNSMIANKIDWSEIQELIDEAKEENHVVASLISKLKLETNRIVLALKNPDDEEDERDESEDAKPMLVEIDLGLNAFKNSRKYYDNKKSAVVKEQKTIDASDKALKSAERKAFEILKHANKIKLISKNRKPFWFEKFYWFISSENYLVIGGRDQQQNEIVVKKYLKAGDLYVHADLHGASSVVIKNPSGGEVPPKTLNEAGCMAVCYSVAWEAKVLANAWWVYNHQVSKQAPTGEYLGTGSFMIRGKKNFLPQTALVFGFGILYKLDDESVFRHKNDRCVKTAEEEEASENALSNVVFDDVEIKNEEVDGDKVEDEKEVVSSEKPDEQIVEKDLDEKLKIEDEEEKKDEQFQFPETAFEMKLVSKIEPQSSKSEKNDENVEKESSSSESQDEDVEKDKTKHDTEDSKEMHLIGKIPPKKSAEQYKKPQDDNLKNASSTSKASNGPLKRGQKARLNKMKTKYKDQDDEDRQLIMQYLASSGKESKEAKSKEKQKLEEAKNKKQQQQMKANEKKKMPMKRVEFVETHKEDSSITTVAGGEEQAKSSELAKQTEDNDIEIEDDTAQNVEEEIGVIDSLTGMPTEEDEILFCIAVCAPYTTLQNYKHKVKLNPGTTKRGQAVKTALEIFNRDTKTTNRERDLIKLNLTKETDTTRNLPGKVKVSAPNLQRLKKK